MVVFVEEKNRIYCKDAEGKMVAEVTFPEVEENVVDINHTFVDDSLRGQGIASQLMEAVAAKAARENLKLIPTCSYAIRWFEKNSQHQDLVKK